MTEYLIPLAETEPNSFGKTFRSLFVYRTAIGSSPTRINVWDNTGRPNRRNGEPVRFGQCGPLDGGNGMYLDPHNHATDAATSVLVTPEASVISAHGNGTGTQASGQVYDPQRAVLATGDVLVLVFPNMSTERVTVRLTNNGHGVAE